MATRRQGSAATSAPKKPRAGLPVPHDSIPGLREAMEEVAREIDQQRELAFLDVSVELCKATVKQFRPDHWRLLSLAQNPFIAGGDIQPVDILQFLWTVSTGFCDDASKAEEFAAEFQIEPGEEAECVAEIQAYIASAFADRRTGGHSSAAVPSACVSASLFHDIHTAYPRIAEQVLAMPFGAIFQLIRLIDEDAYRRAGRTPPPTFSRADKARKEFKKQFYAQQKKETESHA